MALAPGASMRPRDTRLRVLVAVYTSITTRGVPPTIAELAVELGICSKNGVAYHLVALRDEDEFVTWEPGKQRTLRLTERGIAHLGKLTEDPISRLAEARSVLRVA